MTAHACGECTLCCKLERIVEINKPRFQVCPHCDAGCKVYPDRPASCRQWSCNWLVSDLPDEYRPDRTHVYAHVDDGGSWARVMVDPDWADAWKDGLGAKVVDHFVERGTHVMVIVGDQVNFVGGKDKPRPSRIQLDWTL